MHSINAHHWTGICLLGFLIVISPALSYWLEGPAIRRLRSSRERVRQYWTTIVMEWALGAVAVWVIGWPATWAAPAISLPWWARMVLLGLVSAFFALSLMPFFQGLRGKRVRAAYARAYFRTMGDCAALLPISGPERLWFAALSLSAGVCEEVVFRGFLIRSVMVHPLHLSVAIAFILSTLVFGLNHSYQGWSGILRTALAGLALGGLFLLTGSLLLPILVHAAIDLQGVFVLKEGKPEMAPAAA